jgi:hypothetical protein
MSDFTWYLQGTSDTEIEDTDILQFASGTFDSRMLVGDFNESTHVKTSGGADKSSGNTPNNNRYVSINEVSVNEGSDQALNTVVDGEAILKIVIEDTSSFEVESGKFYISGNDIDFQVAEVGDTNFTQAIDSASALDLDDKSTPATSQTYYLIASLSPETFGTLSATMRFEGVLS